MGYLNRLVLKAGILGDVIDFCQSNYKDYNSIMDKKELFKVLIHKRTLFSKSLSSNILQDSKFQEIVHSHCKQDLPLLVILLCICEDIYFRKAFEVNVRDLIEITHNEIDKSMITLTKQELFEELDYFYKLYWYLIKTHTM